MNLISFSIMYLQFDIYTKLQNCSKFCNEPYTSKFWLCLPLSWCIFFCIQDLMLLWVDLPHAVILICPISTLLLFTPPLFSLLFHMSPLVDQVSPFFIISPPFLTLMAKGLYIVFDQNFFVNFDDNFQSSIPVL